MSNLINNVTSTTRYNDVTITVDYEWEGSPPIIIDAIISVNSDYSSPIGVPYVSTTSYGNNQYQAIFELSGLTPYQLYYSKVRMQEASQPYTVFSEFVGTFTTGPPKRLNLTGSTIDKNLIDLTLEIDMATGDPQCSFELHYAENATPTMSDPSLYPDSSTSNPPHYEFGYTTPGLKYDTPYVFTVWLYETADPTNIIETDTVVIITDQDGSRITSVSSTVKGKRATVAANVTLGTQDFYMLKIVYSTNQSLSPSTTKNYNRVDSISLWDKIFYFDLTNLHENKQYYYRVELWNTTTNQLIDTETGTFKTEKDGFPLWMYLHYFV